MLSQFTESIASSYCFFNYYLWELLFSKTFITMIRSDESSIEVIPKLIQHFPTFSPTAALLLRTTSDSSLFPFVLKLLLFAKSAKGRQESSLGFILTVVPVHPTSSEPEPHQPTFKSLSIFLRHFFELCDCWGFQFLMKLIGVPQQPFSQSAAFIPSARSSPSFICERCNYKPDMLHLTSLHNQAISAIRSYNFSALASNLSHAAPHGYGHQSEHGCAVFSHWKHHGRHDCVA